MHNSRLVWVVFAIAKDGTHCASCDIFRCAFHRDSADGDQARSTALDVGDFAISRKVECNVCTDADVTIVIIWYDARLTAAG